MHKPTIGRIVLYKNSDGVTAPAIIVYVGEPEKENSWVNLRVFQNSSATPDYVTSVPKNALTEDQAQYSWEWPTKS